MSKMGWVHYLVNKGNKDNLSDYLRSIGFNNPGFAADEFIKANNQLKEDKSGRRNDKDSG